MELSLLLMNKIAAMLLWAAVGYLLVRVRLMRSDECKTLSNLLIYVLIPCTIVHAFQIEMTQDRVTSLAACTVFVVLIHLIWILAARLLKKPLRLTDTDRATLIYTNCGNLIIPLVSMVFGEEYVFYVAGYQCVFTVFIWTHGVLLLGGRQNVTAKKVILNPNVIAIFVGVFLMLTRIRLPGILTTSMNGFAEMVGPVSMLVIGMVLAKENLAAAFRVKKAAPLTLMRLILFPLLILALLYLSGVLRLRPEWIPVFQITLLSIAAPPATLVSQIAVMFDRNAFEASACNIIGTLLCVLTMPLMLYLYQLMFPFPV